MHHYTTKHNESPCNLRWYLKIEQSQLEKTKLQHAQYANPYGSPYVLNSNRHHPQIRTEADLLQAVRQHYHRRIPRYKTNKGYGR
jgi:hypothetical protein